MKIWFKKWQESVILKQKTKTHNFPHYPLTTQWGRDSTPGAAAKKPGLLLPLGPSQRPSSPEEEYHPSISHSIPSCWAWLMRQGFHARWGEQLRTSSSPTPNPDIFNPIENRVIQREVCHCSHSQLRSPA